MNKGWYSCEVKNRDELNKYSWAQGFFHASHENWDGKTWTRNFHELRCRDLALFTLGDINGKNVLDVGCGQGEYLITMAKMGALVSGQDLSADAMKACGEKLVEEGFSGNLKTGDATILQFPDESFDCVFSSDFFEHISLEQKRKVIAEVFRVLKPGGVFTIKTPNLTYLRIAINVKRIFNILRLKSPFVYIPHTNNNPNNEHHGLTTYNELEDVLEENFFHKPKITFIPLVRKGLPKVFSKLLFGKECFTEHIIITTRKALFYGIYK